MMKKITGVIVGVLIIFLCVSFIFIFKANTSNSANNTTNLINKTEFMNSCRQTEKDEFLECKYKVTGDIESCQNIEDSDYQNGCIFDIIIIESIKKNKNLCSNLASYGFENDDISICNLIIDENYDDNCDNALCLAIKNGDTSACDDDCNANFKIIKAIQSNNISQCDDIKSYEYDCKILINATDDLCDNLRNDTCRYEYSLLKSN